MIDKVKKEKYDRILNSVVVNDIPLEENSLNEFVSYAVSTFKNKEENLKKTKENRKDILAMIPKKLLKEIEENIDERTYTEDIYHGIKISFLIISFVDANGNVLFCKDEDYNYVTFPKEVSKVIDLYVDESVEINPNCPAVKAAIKAKELEHKKLLEKVEAFAKAKGLEFSDIWFAIVDHLGIGV